MESGEKKDKGWVEKRHKLDVGLEKVKGSVCCIQQRGKKMGKWYGDEFHFDVFLENKESIMTNEGFPFHRRWKGEQ